MRTATCVECGAAFGYSTPGRPSVTCSDRCRRQREQRLAEARTHRWARRIVARELLEETAR